MENQNAVLIKDENNKYFGEKNVALELNYRNGEQRLNVKVFFSKAWHDIVKGFGYVLLPFKRKLNVDLDRTCLFYANGAIHLTKVVDRKTQDICRIHHKHFVDVVTGCEYCSHPFYECRKVIPYDINAVNGEWNFGVFGSPINYLTNEEYVKMNDYGTSNQEKLAIVYSMLERANEEHIEQSKELSQKR